MAVAAVLFASFALLLWRDYSHLHYTILGRLDTVVTEPVREQLHHLEGNLYIGFRGLSLAAIGFGVLSWRSSESRVAVAVSVLLAGVVLAINIWMFL